VTIKILSKHDRQLLARVADGVFDRAIDPRLSEEFLTDPRHHLAVAIEDGVVVGMASAVHYVNPDKPPELWINEIGVAPTHRNQHVGRRLLQALLDRGRELNCLQSWVLTDRSNLPAMQLYRACGGVEAPRDQVMFTFKLPSNGRGN
jgi:aminoglycoside 6'-N-acetyltransferase I